MIREAVTCTQSAQSKGKHMTRTMLPNGFIKTLLTMALLAGLPTLAEAQTLDRVQAAGKLVLGYETDARPFSFDAAGKPDGFAITLCGKVADEVKAQINQPALAVEWVPVKMEDRFNAVRDGRIDLLCGADSITLTQSAVVSFSLSIFPSGTGAVLRTDAPAGLREILSDEQLPSRPIWRGSPARTFLEKKTFSAVAGSTSEAWVKERMQSLNLASDLVPVSTVDEGIQRVIDGQSAVFFGALPILLDAAARSASSGNLTVLPRQFTYEPLGFALQRGDEDFRLLVNRALSHAYREEGFRDLFTQWFGKPDESLVTFFKQTVLPD
jgi:polar amino acid transport system substrate-binding protein